MRLPYLLIGLFIWGVGGFLTYVRVPQAAILVFFVAGLAFIILGVIGLFIKKREPPVRQPVKPRQKKH